MCGGESRCGLTGGPLRTNTLSHAQSTPSAIPPARANDQASYFFADLKAVSAELNVGLLNEVLKSAP
jgi:hypothetical protein